MIGVPRRIKKLTGRYSQIDSIPFKLHVVCAESPVIMAAFTVDAKRAKELMPYEVHPLTLWNGRAVLLVAVINYLDTNIGKYIEYSIGVACTRGLKEAPKLLPGLLQKTFGTGQYVLDLPVSTDVSVKGGKGIWGMPKHKASLNFLEEGKKLSSQYDLDDKLVTYLEIEKPTGMGLPFNMNAANYCSFRGMLMKSYINMKGKAHFCLGKNAKAKFVIGEHERSGPLRYLDIDENALFTAYIPNVVGTLDDHIESWFLSDSEEIAYQPEGMESVMDLTRSEEWPPAPTAEISSWDDVPAEIKEEIACQEADKTV